MIINGIPYIHKEGQFKRAKAIIVKTTNMGPIPAEALLTNAGVPYLTNDKQFIMTTGSQNLTSTSTEDFILYEFLTYIPRIIK